jgi:hypothetical protein
MKVFRFPVIVFLSLFIFSCSSTKKISAPAPTISGLKFINEYVVPNTFSFKGTIAGGLSSIDYDPASNLYYIVCDDRSERNPARFYTARIIISDKGIDSVQFVDAVTLLDKNGNPYPSTKIDPSHAPDPESMRYNRLKNELVWGSEGERIMTTEKTAIEDPAVYITALDGKLKDSFALPANMHMQMIEKGPRRNGVFEGLAFSGDYRYLYVSVEEPLYEDGPRAGSGDSTAWVRFIKFNTRTRKAVAQYAYQVDALPYVSDPPGAFRINGISDIMYAGKDKLLVMERGYVSGKGSNIIHVYMADMSHADDISAITSLDPAPTVKPISKKLLLNMEDLGRYIDNVEGLTFGPVLPNGHQSLIFVADNNFDTKEKTQFFLFEVLP